MVERYDPKHPWGKPGPNSQIVGITMDNGNLAVRARRARIAMQKGEQVSLEDAMLVQDREDYIQRIAQSRTEEE